MLDAMNWNNTLKIARKQTSKATDANTKDGENGETTWLHSSSNSLLVEELPNVSSRNKNS